MQFPNLILWLQRRRRKPPPPRQSSRAKLLVVVEGRHDVMFLRTPSRILYASDAAIPDLDSLESAGELVFLPFGGCDVLAWADRLAVIGLSELHSFLNGWLASGNS